MKPPTQRVHELATAARRKQLAVQGILNGLTHIAHTQPFTAEQHESLRQAYRLIRSTTNR